MNNIQIKVKKLKEGAVMPTRGTEYAAGSDLYACIDSPVVIAPHETVMIGTGLAMEIPAGYAGLIYPRSGIASRRGLAPANKVGVVDRTTEANLWWQCTITQKHLPPLSRAKE